MLDHTDPVTLPNIDATEPALKFPNITRTTAGRNPLLNVTLPRTTSPDFPLLEASPSSPTKINFPPLPDHHKILDVNAHGADATTDSISLDSSRTFTAAFNQTERPSTPPSTYSSRNLSPLSRPPSISRHEWSTFTADLERAAALSIRRKTFAVAIGTAIPGHTNQEMVTWGSWRYLDPKGVKSRLNKESYREQMQKRESAGVVVARWNGRWADRGVRVASEVKSKRVNKMVARVDGGVVVSEQGGDGGGVD